MDNLDRIIAEMRKLAAENERRNIASFYLRDYADRLTAIAGANDERYRAGYAAGVADVKRSPYYDDSCDTKPVALAGAAPDWVMVPRELTAENGAKAALMGEVQFKVKDGSGWHDVPWNAIKELHRKIVAHFAATPHAPAKAREDGLAIYAKRNLRKLIESGSTDKALMLMNLEELS